VSIWVASLVGILSTVAACSSEPVGLGEDCKSKEDCKEGLYCSAGGDLKGRCTADCDDTSFCEAHFGENAVCYAREQCARRCASNGECGDGRCAPLTSGASVCISEPPPRPATGGNGGVSAGGTSFGGTTSSGGAGGSEMSGGTGGTTATGGSSGSGACMSDDDCLSLDTSLYCCPLEGSDRRCGPVSCAAPPDTERPDGDPCDSNLQCASDFCSNGVCRPAPGPVGSVCTDAGECASGFCCAETGGKRCSAAECPALAGDACPGEFCATGMFCRRYDSLTVGYCSRSCGAGCGVNSSGRANVCVRQTQGSSPLSVCKPGCSSDADCQAVDPLLGCLTSNSGAVTACDYTTSDWDPNL
jgi:hypothetical protein